MNAFAYADIDTSYKYVIPESVQVLTTASQLTAYINSESARDRIIAAIKLGDIKTAESFELLKQAIEREPCMPGIDIPKGVKYYALISIGKLGTPAAEDYLINFIKSYSKKEYLSHFTGKGYLNATQDTLLSILGALDGLEIISSPTAVSFFNSTFNNEYYYWPIRGFAFVRLLRATLKNDNFHTGADTANFLIDGYIKTIGVDDMWSEDAVINVNFITGDNFKFLLYQYKKTTLPYIIDKINSLTPDDPVRIDLEKMRNNIEANMNLGN